MFFRTQVKIIAAVSLLASASTQAAPPAPSKSVSFGYVSPFTGPLKLLKTHLEHYNEQGLAVGPDAWYGSPLTVSCPNAAGCYVVVSANAQVYSFSSPRPVALGIQIGSYYSAPYNIKANQDDFTLLSYKVGTMVPKGDHKIMTRYIGAAGTPASLFEYTTEVSVYKPI
ncbi:hypothetical protein [Ideonella paludis]|uniref:Uncharacterized protein n=1 Tax=Ideonella paludis TaxID=1233411 RepID=A0ABS5DYT5_9BURK|nr:hypothetical protein [Ideonella paludis]MBQ0936313.1 hypothetical protein [Ideonella paludis]